MTFHMVAYYESTSVAAASAFDEFPVPAVRDEVMLVQNGNLVLSRDLSLVAVTAGCSMAGSGPATLAQASMLGPLTILPTAQAGASPPGIMNLFRNRTMLRGGEETLARMRRTIGTQYSVVLAFLTDGSVPAPAGDSYWMRDVGNFNALPAPTWTVVDPLFRSLPRGRYAVIGAMADGGGCLAARIRFADQVFRPGVPAFSMSGRPIDDMFVDGSLGVWGTFDALAPPTIEVLAGNNAGTALSVALRVVRLDGAQT